MEQFPDLQHKRRLRTEMTELRASIPASDREQQSNSACKLAELEVLGPLRDRAPDKRLIICSYLSFGEELDTGPLVRDCLSSGDTVLVPKIGHQRQLSLHRITSQADLESGVWGIMEPAEHVPAFPESKWPTIDVIVVPGLAFDVHGGRIGYGGGYYDRMVEKLRGLAGGIIPARLAALVLKEQLVDSVPMEVHDFRLDMLITASKVIHIDKGSDPNG